MVERGKLHTENRKLVIYIQKDEPGDPTRKKNWLPAPEGGFQFAARFYGPHGSADRRQLQHAERRAELGKVMFRRDMSPVDECSWLNSAVGRRRRSSVGWARRGFSCYSRLDALVQARTAARRAVHIHLKGNHDACPVLIGRVLP